MHSRFLVAVFLLLVGCAHPQFTFSTEARIAEGQDPAPMNHRARAATLQNGLRVVAYQFQGEQDAQVILSFPGGLKAEPVGKEGVSSLAEFLAYQAAPGRGGVRLQERIYAAGIVSHSFNVRDEIAFSLTAKASKLEEALRIEKLRLQEPVAGLTEAQVERAREHLAARLERSPLGYMDQAQLVESMAMSGTPYGRAQATPEGLRKLTLEDVKDYLQAVIRPEGAVLTVATGQPPDDTLKLIGELIAPVISTTIQRPPRSEFYRPASRAKATEKLLVRADLRRLWVAWSFGGEQGLGEPMLRFAGGYLRRAVGERLAKERSSKEITGVGGFAWSRESAAVILVSVILQPAEDPERIRAIIEGAVELTRERLQKEAVYAVFSYSSGFRMLRDRYTANEGRTPLLDVARSVRTTGEATPSAAFQRSVDALVAPGAASRLAALFDAGPSAAVLFEPLERPAPPPDGSLLSGTTGPEWAELPSFDRGSAPGPEAVRSLLDPPRLSSAARRTLANGLEVAVVVKRGTPFAVSALSFPGVNGNAEVVRARSWLKDVKKALPPGCGEAVAMVGRDGVILTVANPAAGLRHGLEALSCWFTAGQVDVKDEGVTPAARVVLAAQERGALAAPPPPIDDQPRWGERWARRTMRPSGATLVVAGDLVPEEVFASAAAVFGGWSPPREQAFPALAPTVLPEPLERSTVLFEQANASQGWASVTVRAMGASPGNEAEQLVLTNMLKDRLDRTLGLSGLEVVVERVSVPGLHSLGVVFKGRPDRLVPALKRVLDELASLDSTINDPVALATARWNVARSLAFAFSKTTQLALRAAALANASLPPDGYEHLDDEVANVSTSRLLQVKSRYSIGKEGIRLGGPAEVLVPALQALGLDPTRVDEVRMPTSED